MEDRAASFATTRWSLVMSARGSAGRAALGELCALYWEPAYLYLRRRGMEPEEAMDLTQGFIARLLERGGIDGADPHRGRFRSFFLGALKHYVANESAKARAQKRGGGVAALPLDFAGAEERLAREAADSQTPESAYLRRWALGVLEETLGTLRGRYEQEGKAELFERLHPLITGEKPAARYRALGTELGMSEDAVKTAVSRLRKRYREELRAKIAETVADPAEIDDELRNLIEALRGQG